ncbi:MAG: aminotransferase class I/II-fold pyridoxal phosphate-dependent enzyme, partial [Deltaproteobacteria bacterium]|nr:aminotransferase class I/II-fold pyridoxal phosphate-dependent enzyme [Deltaproteobacteria bacterium]
SIIDGCRLSFGQVKKYRHNDMKDLERVLEASKDKGKLIIVDGVFSMEGDIADLPPIIKLAKAYGARVMVDDAHGVGVLGKGGRGTAEHFDLEKEVDLIMGTYSKSLAAIGGFVTGSWEVINFIKHTGRSMIFSASLPPALVASVSTALDIIEEQPQLITQLWKNTRKMLQGYKEMGFDTGTSETPIVPIILGDTMKVYGMCKLLFQNGIFVNPVASPAVPQGRELLRTSYMATHTEEQLDRVLNAFQVVGRQMGLV